MLKNQYFPQHVFYIIGKGMLPFVKKNKTLLFVNDCLQITLGYQCGLHDWQNTGNVMVLTFTKGAQELGEVAVVIAFSQAIFAGRKKHLRAYTLRAELAGPQMGEVLNKTMQNK